MEQRSARIMTQRSGGTAGPGGECGRVALPTAWVKKLGLYGESRSVSLQFDGESITIRPKAASGYHAFLRDAQRAGHDLLLLSYYDGGRLCSKICADRTARTVAVENNTDDPLETAFGVNTAPDWAAFERFLEGRCVPRQRDGLNRYLKTLGLDEYDPLAIVRRTEGRMAEDNFYLEIREG